MENSLESIIILDLKKKVIHLNKAAEIKFGIPSNQARGDSGIPYLTAKEFQSKLESLIEQIKANTLGAKRIICPDPKENHIFNEISINPYFNLDNTKIEGFNINLRRIITGNSEINNSPFFIDNIVKGYEQSKHEAVNTEDIIASFSESFRKEEIDYNNRQRIATIAAVTLLVLTAILITNAVFSSGSLKYIFGTGSILTSLGQYWPVKFLLKDKREGFKARALNKIMNSSALDQEKLDTALELLEKIQGSMKNESIKEK